MKDKHTKMPRGFGFVTFSDPSVIDKVLQDEHTIDGRTVEVKRTVPREEMSSKDGPKTRKIFVGGIPPSLTEDKLKEHFSSYGKVVEHQIMLDHGTGRSRGFGFVTFENEDAVERVMSEGRMHDLAGKQVTSFPCFQVFLLFNIVNFSVLMSLSINWYKWICF
jgi:heterogeneous nuclear ribonucleoprotein A1/A3